MCIESVCSEWLCILLLWDYCYILDRKQLLVRWPGLWFISWFFAVKKSKNVSKRRKKLRRRRRYLYHFSMIWWDLSVWADAVSLKKLHYIAILRFTGIVNDVSLYMYMKTKKKKIMDLRSLAGRSPGLIPGFNLKRSNSRKFHDVSNIMYDA